MSMLFSRRWVAKEWRRVWVWTFFRLERFAADEIIFWMFLVEIFSFLPEKRYFWLILFCWSTWFFSWSSRKSGILNILSLLPFAWRMWPIFSGKFRSSILRLVSSETRNPAA